jgi:hypothetical protein
MPDKKPRPPKILTKYISFYVNEDQRARLDQLIQDTQGSLPKVLRQALEDFLSKKGYPEKKAAAPSPKKPKAKKAPSPTPAPAPASPEVVAPAPTESEKEST